LINNHPVFVVSGEAPTSGVECECERLSGDVFLGANNRFVFFHQAESVWGSVFDGVGKHELRTVGSEKVIEPRQMNSLAQAIRHCNRSGVRVPKTSLVGVKVVMPVFGQMGQYGSSAFLAIASRINRLCSGTCIVPKPVSGVDCTGYRAGHLNYPATIFYECHEKYS